jgi:hypothetical protein
MGRHRSNADDDTVGIPKILTKMVKLSAQNDARKNAVKVQKCGEVGCNAGTNLDCSCAGTGNATDWT